MLFSVTLLEYVQATNDLQTAQDLFPIAFKQFTIFTRNLSDEEGSLRYKMPENGKGHFIDCEVVVGLYIGR
jgi:hypothetical protein